MDNSEYNLRYIAQFVIEAKTPLHLSSGKQDALTDSLVMTDANGLPMIPGTSLCGVLRDAFAVATKTQQIIHNPNRPVSFIDEMFGYQGKKDDGRGSRLLVSNAHFIGQDGEVIEGLWKMNLADDFYAKFATLPIREHCKISHQGATDAGDNGKFDNQVTYKGTRFKFELELIGDESEIDDWYNLLSLLNNSAFRLGGGTRKGYGAIEVVSAKSAIFDLTKPEQLDTYLAKSAKLADDLPNANDIKTAMKINKNWVKYELTLTPEDFYSFGSGFGDDEVDITPVYEEIIEWNNNIPHFTNKKILIPASSIKGAIAHRVAFHYNKLQGVYADKITDEIKKYVGENNTAVKTLFGFAKDSKNTDKEKQQGQRGNVILSDIFIDNSGSEKILNHVAIDRFTGGARDGALFDEKVITQKEPINLEILVDEKVLEDENIETALERTLKDITSSMLPLGGSTMRGHGCFSGKIIKNGEQI